MAKSGVIGIVCGLRSEAKAVRAACGDDPRIRIGISGANALRAEEIAREFCDEGARAVLSIGVSGGLDPILAPGDLLLGETVRFPSGAAYTPDAALVQSLVEAAPNARAVLLYGSDEIVVDAAGKSHLFNAYGAAAVDMESHAVAKAAMETGTTMIAIRAIADPADRAMPPAALNAVAPDGSTRVMKTLGAALRDPKQFPALMKLGADSEAALKTLRRDLGAILVRLFEALERKQPPA